MNFEDLKIEKSVLGSIKKLGFKEPTKIQVEAIPAVKEGRDIIAQSETGSGKTAAFGIPIIEKAEREKGIQALILAPTRELASQIAGDLKDLSGMKGLRIAAIYGGVSLMPQVDALQDADIVVGTPGRVMDHLERGNFETGNIKFFVLDEADKMISMGFIEDIQMIERQIPSERQTLLFSATMPDNLMGMAESFTNEAKRIKTSTKVREDVLKQFYYDVDRTQKFSLLVHILNEEKPDLFIVFCNTRYEANDVTRNLKEQGVNAEYLHGGLTQSGRERTVERFHKGEIKCLVATNVAARGLDIKDVSHVFNYSIPKDAEDYANRIGRTARAGKSGKAISLISRDDHAPFGKILNTFSYNVEKVPTPEFEKLPFHRNSRGGFGGRGFGRGFNRSGFGRSGRSGFGRSGTSGRGRPSGRKMGRKRF